MKKSISKVLSLVLALAFVFSLAACGGAPSSAPAASGSAPASGSEPAAPADPTTLKVYTWWDVTKFEHLQKMQQDFEAANPDIKLEFVTIPSQYADTMVLSLIHICSSLPETCGARPRPRLLRTSAGCRGTYARYCLCA